MGSIYRKEKKTHNQKLAKFSIFTLFNIRLIVRQHGGKTALEEKSSKYFTLSDIIAYLLYFLNCYLNTLVGSTNECSDNLSVFLRDCSDCTILCACQQLRTRDCARIELALHCATQPIIENSTNMVFHPLVINYPGFRGNLFFEILFPGNICWKEFVFGQKVSNIWVFKWDRRN